MAAAVASARPSVKQTASPMRPFGSMGTAAWRSIKLAPMPTSIDDVLTQRRGVVEDGATVQPVVSMGDLKRAPLLAESDTAIGSVQSNAAARLPRAPSRGATKSNLKPVEPAAVSCTSWSASAASHAAHFPQDIDQASTAGTRRTSIAQSSTTWQSATSAAQTTSTVGSLTAGRVLSLRNRLPTLPRLQGSPDEEVQGESMAVVRARQSVSGNPMACDADLGASVFSRRSSIIIERREDESYLAFLLRKHGSLFRRSSSAKAPSVAGSIAASKAGSHRSHGSRRSHGSNKRYSPSESSLTESSGAGGGSAIDMMARMVRRAERLVNKHRASVMPDELLAESPTGDAKAVGIGGDAQAEVLGPKALEPKRSASEETVTASSDDGASPPAARGGTISANECSAVQVDSRAHNTGKGKAHGIGTERRVSISTAARRHSVDTTTRRSSVSGEQRRFSIRSLLPEGVTKARRASLASAVASSFQKGGNGIKQYYEAGLKAALGTLRNVLYPVDDEAEEGEEFEPEARPPRAARSMSMLALAAGVQSKRQACGMSGPLKAGTQRGAVNLSEISGPLPRIEGDSGMLQHGQREGALRTKRLLSDARAEDARRDSVAKLPKRRGSNASVMSRVSIVSKASRASSSAISKVSTMRTARSSIFSEAAATALLMQQRALEAAMLDAYMATTHEITAQSIARTAKDPMTAETSTNLAARSAERQLSQVHLAKVALEASNKLKTTLEERAIREDLAKRAELAGRRMSVAGTEALPAANKAPLSGGAASGGMASGPCAPWSSDEPTVDMPREEKSGYRLTQEELMRIKKARAEQVSKRSQAQPPPSKSKAKDEAADASSRIATRRPSNAPMPQLQAREEHVTYALGSRRGSVVQEAVIPSRRGSVLPDETVPPSSMTARRPSAVGASVVAGNLPAVPSRFGSRRTSTVLPEPQRRGSVQRRASLNLEPLMQEDEDGAESLVEEQLETEEERQAQNREARAEAEDGEAAASAIDEATLDTCLQEGVLAEAAPIAMQASRRVSFTMAPMPLSSTGGAGAGGAAAELRSSAVRRNSHRLSAASLSSSVRRALVSMRGSLRASTSASMRRRSSAVSAASEDYKNADGARVASEATDRSNREHELMEMETNLAAAAANEQRERLMREIQGSEAVRQQIHSLFSIGAKPVDAGQLGLLRQDYADFHLSFCRWLMSEGGEPFVEQDAYESFLFDWQNDSQGAAYLTFEAFFLLAFEIVEMWLSSQDSAGLPQEDEYVIFIDSLTDAVTTLDETGTGLCFAHRWPRQNPKQAETEEGGLSNEVVQECLSESVP